MSATPRNLAWLRSLKLDGVPEFGTRLHELVTDLVTNQNQIAQQTNSSLEGHPAAPPPLQRVTATPTTTGIHVSIQHEGDFYRGITYHGDYSASPAFTNPFPFSMGPSREHDLPIGNQTVHVRVIGQYPTGSPTTPVYHGGTTPIPVTGGTAGTLGPSQGSGTGKPGQGLQGWGQQAYRSTTGNPPTR